MARCEHGFELTLVACTAGCGGKNAQQQRINRIQARKPERATAAARSITAEQIAAALEGAPGVRHAREKLGISEATLVKHVRASEKLQRLYAEAKERGQKVSRARFGWRRA